MNPGVKISIYVILVALTCVTGLMFFKNFGSLFADDAPPAAQQAAAPAPAPEVTEPDPSTTTDTNTPPATNTVPETAVVDTNAPAATETNVVAQAPTTTVETNAIPTAGSPTLAGDDPTATPGVQTATTMKKPPGRIGFWTGSFVLCVIALGGFIAWDVSNAAGNKALTLLYNDDGAGQKDPEYDQAEQMWANGQPLEAIRMMREYLNKHPREVHVALRIAEIYEKDLNNFLAAALEYEEVLKKKLEPERWGWAAIHLCNLYFKLNQEDKGYRLLQRIIREQGDTQAAEKARKRLGEAAPEMLAEAEGGGGGAEIEEAPAKPVKKADDSPKQVSNLPPGFRPKK